jgi:glycosyltransferase involved in cell wall biosynthesis
MGQDRLTDSVLRAARQAWRAIAPASMRSVAQPLVAMLAERRVRQALAQGEPAAAPGPLVVSGLLSESKGVSQAARLTVVGLRAAGYLPVEHDLRPLLAAGPGASGKLPVDRPGGVWITHINAPEAMHALAYLDSAQWLGRRRIGFWAYELPRVPALWVRASEFFHEIWAPSHFVADALATSGVTKPVRVMPHPAALAKIDARPDRTAFQIPASDFVVLAMGDLRSSAMRKNLIGAIEIYKRAFPGTGDGSRLILKVQSANAHPRFRKAAGLAAAGRPDILFFTDDLSPTEIGRFIASCDVLLSPHRSEGFGLPLAEAFLAGVPALATGWSGNLDFMSDLPELTIRHTLVPVRDPFGVYRARGQSWAEPDSDDAVAKLKALAASPDLRARLAARGRAAVEAQASAWSRETLDQTVLGELMR